MLLTGETNVPGDKPCPSATFSTINPTSTNLGLNLALRAEGPESCVLAFTIIPRFIT